MRNRLRSSASERIARLEAEVAELQGAVEEGRRLNERLSDVLDVVTELLVPAVDRDDTRLQQALETLQAYVVAIDRRHQQLGDDVEHVGEPLVEATALLDGVLELGDLGLEPGDPRGRGRAQQISHDVVLTTSPS